MDIVQALSGQPLPVIAVVLSLYLYSKGAAEWHKEKKEIIESIREERAEWIQHSRDTAVALMGMQRESTEAAVRMTTEMHALKSRITEAVLKMDRYDRTDKRHKDEP